MASPKTSPSQPLKTEQPVSQTSASSGPARRNAFARRDWETLFVVATFVVSLLATLAMVLVSVTDKEPDNRFRIVPAASIMVMVELWLLVYLPFYGKLAFWGAVISLATFLFFAVPFIFLGLLPTSYTVGGIISIVMSLLAGLFLFRRRERFFPPAPPTKRTREQGSRPK